MNKKWSGTIQSSKLLYESRLARCNKYTQNSWFDMLNLKHNLNILEVGCGGGSLCNIIKQNFPTCKVTGIDLDSGHIAFAKNTAKKLGVDVNYYVADINSLPFDDNTFDLVFSHTVIEHLPIDIFLKEQARVLKKDGQLVSLNVESKAQLEKVSIADNDKIIKLKDKLFSKQITENKNLGKYNSDIESKIAGFKNNGLTNVEFSFNSILWFCPQNYISDIKFIKGIINTFYISEYEICLMNYKNLNTITEQEFKTLTDLLKLKYKDYINNKSYIYDYRTTMLCVVKGKKL